MSYRSELEEVRSLPYMPTKYAIITEGLPEGLAVEISHGGDQFTPKHWINGIPEKVARGYGNFYQHYDEIWFYSFDEAKDFILQFHAFLQWMSGIAASTPLLGTPKPKQASTHYQDKVARKDWSIDRYVGKPITLYANEDTSERITGIIKEFDTETRAGVAYVGEDGSQEVSFCKRASGKGFRQIV